MTMTVKQIIERNNEMRKLLTPENNRYYEELAVYIKMNHFIDERATEDALLKILHQLLEAQQDGKNAEEVFGYDLEQYADKLVQSLPSKTTRSIFEFGLEILFVLFGWFLSIWGIWPLINKEDQTLHVGSLLLSTVLLIVGLILIVIVILMLKRKQSFEEDEKKKSKALWIIGVLGGLLFIVGFFLNFFIEPFGPKLNMSYLTPFGLGCFLLLASYIMKKSREAK